MVNNYNVYKHYIVSSLNNDIFNGEKIAQTRALERQIRSEVIFFKNLLIHNYNNEEVFHGYVNKIYEVWNEILKDEIKELIRHYNIEYSKLLIEINRKKYLQNEMIKMADKFNLKQAEKQLNNLFIDTPGIYNLTDKMSKSNIRFGKKLK